MSARWHRIAGSLLAGSVMLATAACGAQTSTGSASKKPIQIGVIAPFSGAFAQIGQEVFEGAQVAANEINAQGGVNGRKIVFVKEDEKLSPTQTVQDMRDLSSKGVSLVLGGTTTPDCQAAMPVAAQDHMTFISFTCADTVLTEPNPSPYFFEIAPRTDELSVAAAHFARSQFPSIQTWNNISDDYNTGHSYWENFSKTLTSVDSSAKLGKSIFVPLQATQFTPYIASMVSAVPAAQAANEGLYLSTYGAGTVALAQQGRSYNLFTRFKAVIDESGNELISASLGKTGPKIYYVYDYYPTAYHNDTNASFIQAFEKAHNVLPGSFNYQGYTAIKAFAAAVKKVNSTDGQKVAQALVGLQFNTPKGTASFLSDHILNVPMTAFECQGDAQSPQGYSCPFAEPISQKGLLPSN